MFLLLIVDVFFDTVADKQNLDKNIRRNPGQIQVPQ